MDELVQIDITLLGRHFIITAPQEKRDTLLEAAEILNEKARAVQSQGKLFEPDKIAMMAALNIAYDFLKIKVAGNLEIGEFQRKIRNISETADSVLQEVQ